MHDLVLIHVYDRECRALLVGDVDAPSLLVDRKGFRAGAGLEPADHVELCDINDVDHIIVPAGDVEPACDRR